RNLVNFVPVTRHGYPYRPVTRLAFGGLEASTLSPGRLRRARGPPRPTDRRGPYLSSLRRPRWVYAAQRLVPGRADPAPRTRAGRARRAAPPGPGVQHVPRGPLQRPHRGHPGAQGRGGRRRGAEAARLPHRAPASPRLLRGLPPLLRRRPPPHRAGVPPEAPLRLPGERHRPARRQHALGRRAGAPPREDPRVALPALPRGRAARRAHLSGAAGAGSVIS